MSSDTPSAGTDTAVAATAWHNELPRRARNRPRAFGVGRYGVDKFDSRDNTRYAWTRVGPAITAFVAVFLSLAAPARATNAYCEATDAVTAGYSFCQPAVDVEGANRWGDKENTNWQMVEDVIAGVDTSTSAPFIAALSVSTVSLNSLKYDKTGGAISGVVTLISASTLTISGNEFSVGASTLSVSGGTTTVNRLQITNPLAVAYGGTGAATAASALSNLGGIGLGSTQTFTGVNTFNGAVVVSSWGAVATSSCSANLSSLSQTQTAFTVGLDTLTITVSGRNPVMVCYSGVMTEAATNGGPFWSFLLDGGYTGSLSSSVGVGGGGQTSSSSWLMTAASSCYMIQPNTLSPGSHRFTFTTKNTNSGAVTLGKSGTPTTYTEARFFVYELH